MHESAQTRHAYVETTLGALQIVAEGPALSGVYFPGHWYPPKRSAIGPELAPDDDPVIAAAATQLREYLAGERREFDIPLATHGSELSQRVWAMLREIPYGERTTYGALAMRLGSRSLAQGVGQAVGHNPISIVIPCHRVVGADGSLTGFAGGLERKQWLLDLESQDDRLF